MVDHLEGVITGFDAWKKLQNYFEANTIQKEITMNESVVVWRWSLMIWTNIFRKLRRCMIRCFE
jgi:hypothetical protein